jgi:AI-2 transport protein TqsA
LLFMSIDAASMPERLAAIGRQRPHVVTALNTFAEGTRRFLLVYTIFGLIVAVLDVAVLLVLGVPLPLLFGLVSLIANYIPNVGFVIGLVPPAVLALLEGGADLMVAVIAVYSGLNVVIQSGIQPKVVGDSVGLSTTLTFVSLVFWSWILGPTGAVLAVPLSLLVRSVLVDADPGNGWLRPLVANRPGP